MPTLMILKVYNVPWKVHTERIASLFFWAHFSAEKEMAEAKTFAEAAKAANLQMQYGQRWKIQEY